MLLCQASLGSLVESGYGLAHIQQQRDLVERIAHSELFQRSPRLREFLLYVSECTLHGSLGDVREQVIAERVFGRRPDPGGQDSIVRAEARNLRKRLETYFAKEGSEEPVLVVMPKGGYSIAFVPRIQGNQAAQPHSEKDTADLSAVAAVEEKPSSEPAMDGRGVKPGLIYALLTVLAAAGLSLALYWHHQAAAVRRHFNLASPVLPFSAIVTEDEPAEIITSDTGFLQIASLLRRRITLDDYITRSYGKDPGTNPPDLMRNWNAYEFTDGREMTIAGLILRRSAQFADKISLRSGHAVQLQDFKDHNMVLIGSPISNPWAQLYEDKLNFRCDFSDDGRILFRNRYPRAHEKDTFPNDDDNQHHREYARIVFLPRTSDAGATLLIAGTTAQSTQAAGEFVTDQSALTATLKSLGVDPYGPPHYFELLIRSNNFAGGAILREVIASRLTGAPDK